MDSVNDKIACSSLIQSTMHGTNGSIEILRLNRPARANAYNAVMLNLLEQKVRAIIEKKRFVYLLSQVKVNVLFVLDQIKMS